jgi:hypothetical protein
VVPAGPEPVACLFLRHPSLVAYVAGHEHRNRIEPHERIPGRPDAGGFWEIVTASHIQWPQQGSCHRADRRR